jgi:antirestriction protein ArdC
MNYSPILEGFAAKGIPMSEILPRENVLTFWAWKELGRRVKKGEHGVKCTTFILASKKDAETGEVKSGPFKVPHTVTVFHVSQTEPDTPQKGD